jgi:hypothetical protein
MHAFELSDRVPWIVAELSKFNQHGCSLSMIRFANASTILRFFHLKCFLPASNPLPYDFTGKQGPEVIC